MNNVITTTKFNENIIIFRFKTTKYHITLLNIGGAIWKLQTPDKNGTFDDIIISHKNPQDYFDNQTYQGVIIGRNAGRIAGGKFKIGQKKYQLPKNDNNNNLHSSNNGISKRILKHVIIDNKLIFSILLKSHHDKFPGDINIKITYTFNADYFQISYEAQANENTICNLTNHVYWNLNNKQKNILNHKLANTFKYIYQLDENNIPQHPIRANNFFKNGNDINNIIINNDNFFYHQNGLDHPFILQNNKTIILESPETKRKLKIETSYPCAVIYTQNWKTSELNNKVHCGIAIETQHLPNDINFNPQSRTLLRKNQKYSEWTKYIF